MIIYHGKMLIRHSGLEFDQITDVRRVQFWREGILMLKALESCLVRSWYRSSGAGLSIAGSPLLAGEFLYRQGLKHDQRRSRRKQKALPVPVISVGNLTVGGTGKTPFVLWLSDHLRERGLKPAVLSRGYGRSGQEIEIVPVTGDTAPMVSRFGDEPLLMARKRPSIPVWVGRNRWDAGNEAIVHSGADSIILDDGFQHLKLKRDLDLVLLDAERPFGNGRLIPAGPLREPISHLERADAFILTRAEDQVSAARTRKTLERLFPGKPVFTCRHEIVGWTTGFRGYGVALEAFQEESCVVFAGIAHPHKFLASIKKMGIDSCLFLAFPDHHLYSHTDIIDLLQKSYETGASFLLTTEKDMVRLPAFLQDTVAAAELKLNFGPEQERLRQFIDERLKKVGCDG